MDIEEFALKNGLSKELVTHDEYYQTLVDLLGYEDVLKYVPYSLRQIADVLITGDEHLNNLPLHKWDEMTGVGLKEGNCPYLNHKGLYFIYKKHKITAYSCATGVCILKACARMAVVREGLLNVNNCNK